MNSKKALVFFFLFSMIFIFTQELLIDKMIDLSSYFFTRLSTVGFYKEPKDSLDIVAIGPSTISTALSPAILWRDYGWTSYDFNAGQQPLWISYYMVKEALKYQRKAIFVLDLGMINRDKNSVDDNLITVSFLNMPMSLNKLSAIQDSIEYGKNIWTHLFPIIRYHSTWRSLDKERISFMFYNKEHASRGYVSSPISDPQWKCYGKTNDIVPPSEIVQKSILRIVKLCKKNRIPLVIVRTPIAESCVRENVNWVKDLANKNNVPFIDFNDIMGDHPLHISYIASEKFTGLLAKYLKYHYNLTDKRDDKNYARWNDSVKFLNQEQLKWKLQEKGKNFIEVLKFIKNPNYLVLISTKDSLTKHGKEINNDLNNDLLNAWKNLGLDPNMLSEDKFQFSYIAVIDNERIIYEKLDKERLIWKKYLKGIGRIMIESASATNGNVSSIKFDNVEKSPNMRGFNIVVYDRILKIIVLQTFFGPFEIGK
jgi:hypothetical protein